METSNSFARDVMRVAPPAKTIRSLETERNVRHVLLLPPSCFRSYRSARRNVGVVNTRFRTHDATNVIHSVLIASVTSVTVLNVILRNQLYCNTCKPWRMKMISINEEPAWAFALLGISMMIRVQIRSTRSAASVYLHAQHVKIRKITACNVMEPWTGGTSGKESASKIALRRLLPQ